MSQKTSTKPAGHLGRVLGLGVMLAIGAIAAATVARSAETIEFTDVRSQALQFIEWEKAYELSPEQEAIKREALSAIPAPCCSDNSAYTCCCPCNQAKTWWGLAAYLIVELDYDAAQVRDKVSEWIDYIGPDGFSGDACYTRGCFRPFHKNGCGGMNDQDVVF